MRSLPAGTTLGVVTFEKVKGRGITFNAMFGTFWMLDGI